MKQKFGLALVLLAALGLFGCLTRDTRRHILQTNLRSHIDYLASDSLEGRLVGSSGIEKAGRYIASEFEEIGLRPAFRGSFFQEFSIEFGFRLEGEPALRIGDIDLAYGEEFTVIPFSGSGSVESGAVLWRSGDLSGDDRVLLALTDPETEKDRWTMTGRDGLLEWMRETCVAQASSGAAAVVFVVGTPEEPAAALHRFAVSRTYRPVTIPVLEVTYRALESALAANDISLEKRIAEMSAAGAPTEDAALALGCAIEVATGPATVEVRNVGGLLPGTGSEYIVIGAHYDHLGYGDIASSTPWRREVHCGADDNASGTAALIEIARILSSYGAPERSVVFLAFTAEELGAVGSEYYCKNAPYPVDSTVAMINLDTVGRLEEGKLVAFGARSAEEFGSLLDEAGTGYDLEVVEKQEIYGFSDQNPFYARGVPALHFFTGAHEDYHSPEDVREKINFEGLATLTSFVTGFTSLIAFSHADLTPVVEEAESGTASSRGKGAHLGIIPDFTYAGAGVGIKGTVPESPAEHAGLEDGDVIVGIDDLPIADLQGLMRFLVGSSPGDTIVIQVMRGPAVESVEATLSVRAPRGQSD